MRLLVTGGAGYVGAAVARLLLDVGHEVVIVDDLSRNDAAQVPDGARFERLRVHDVARVLTPGSGFDGVLHFAGLIAAGESMAHPDWHWDNNTRASLALLDAVRAAETPRLVFSSTAAVYGEPTELPVTETAPTDPVNTYGDTKLAVDRAIASTTRAPDSPLGAVSLRYFNVAGALRLHDGTMIGERHDPETHIIPLALDVVAGRREKFALFGQDYPTRDGTCVRDYIHIADLAAAHLLALTAAHPGEHKVYNLGNGAGHSNLEVITAIREVTSHDLPLEMAARRPGDPAALYASSAKARAELGWESQHADLRQIVTDAWEFHQTVSAVPVPGV